MHAEIEKRTDLFLVETQTKPGARWLSLKPDTLTKEQNKMIGDTMKAIDSMGSKERVEVVMSPDTDKNVLPYHRIRVIKPKSSLAITWKEDNDG